MEKSKKENNRKFYLRKKYYKMAKEKIRSKDLERYFTNMCLMKRKPNWEKNRKGIWKSKSSYKE